MDTPDPQTQILQAKATIEQWLEQEWQMFGPPFYASVDLRPSPFKCAPVDLNLFPGGFNHVASSSSLPSALQESLFRHGAVGVERIALIPENHTRNLFYLENVRSLQLALEQSGFEVRIGRLVNDFPEGSSAMELPTSSGHTITQHRIDKQNRHITFHDGWVPDLIINNNDLSSGVPEIMQDLDQAILPPNRAGWKTRKKSVYFDIFQQLAQRFASDIGIDAWFLSPDHRVVHDINFQTSQGEEELAQKVSELLQAIQVNYRQRGIDRDPFVIIKADAGTYGMGIMTARNPDDVRELNRKQRGKMGVVKEGQVVSEVLVQEGVYSDVWVNGALAEPVIYMVDNQTVGAFYRVNGTRRPDENLNAQGMEFSPLTFGQHTDSDFYLYSVVARLSLLAASYELEELKKLA